LIFLLSCLCRVVVVRSGEAVSKRGEEFVDDAREAGMEVEKEELGEVNGVGGSDSTIRVCSGDVETSVTSSRGTVKEIGGVSVIRGGIGIGGGDEEGRNTSELSKGDISKSPGESKDSSP
jgi:hypothetical protein